MKIVIDMPDDICNRIRHLNRCVGLLDACRDRDKFVEAIKNGTPLPEKHGRLIDADDLRKCFGHNINDMYAITEIDKAPTIIDADEAESEDKG